MEDERPRPSEPAASTPSSVAQVREAKRRAVKRRRRVPTLAQRLWRWVGSSLRSSPGGTAYPAAKRRKRNGRG